MGVTVRTPEIVEDILLNVSEGITVAELCRKHGIGRATFYDWLTEDQELAGRFARAREVGFDAIAEEAIEIAEDGSNDWIERRREDGSIDEVLNHEHVQRSKLRIETRLKLLAKWDPKRYGEKQLIGSDPENPLPSPIGLDASKLSTEALREILAARGASDRK